MLVHCHTAKGVAVTEMLSWIKFAAWYDEKLKYH
jgi:hypothetical protein